MLNREGTKKLGFIGDSDQNIFLSLINDEFTKCFLTTYIKKEHIVYYISTIK